MGDAWRRKDRAAAQTAYNDAKAAGKLSENLLVPLLLLNTQSERRSNQLYQNCAEPVRALLDDADDADLTLTKRQLHGILSNFARKEPSAALAELAIEVKTAYVDLGAAVDANTYNQLLQIVVRHNLEKTLEVARSMRSDNVYPNQATYVELVSACTKHNDLPKAQIYLQQMKKMRYKVPTAVLLRVVYASMHSNDADSARVALEMLDDSTQVTGGSLDNNSALGLANLAARTGDAALLRALRDHLMVRPQADPAADIPNLVSSSAFLHARIECSAKANDVDDVFECIRVLEGQGTQVYWSTMCAAAKALGQDEQAIDSAYYKVEKMLEEGGMAGATGVPLDCITLVILGCGKIKDIGRAIETFDAITEVFGLKPSVRSYTAVLDSCIAAGHGQGAHAFIQEMSNSGITPDQVTYSSMIRALVLEGGGSFAVKLNSVASILKQMETESLAPERRALTALVVWSARHKRFKTSWDFVNLMSVSGYAVPESLRRFVRNGGSDTAQRGSPNRLIKSADDKDAKKKKKKDAAAAVDKATAAEEGAATEEEEQVVQGVGSPAGADEQASTSTDAAELEAPKKDSVLGEGL